MRLVRRGVTELIKSKYFSEICWSNEIFPILGTEGVEALSYAILQSSCKIKRINLRLNSFGDQGAKFLFGSLEKEGKTIKTLSIAGCAITKKTSFARMLCRNKTLEVLDISNNRIGEVRFCCFYVKLDTLQKFFVSIFVIQLWS